MARMPGFNRDTVASWLRGRRAAAKRALTVYSPPESIRLSLLLIEAAWPVAQTDLAQKLHEENARPAREVWRRLALATGKLPATASSRTRSARS
jgi:hypothetical protein